MLDALAEFKKSISVLREQWQTHMLTTGSNPVEQADQVLAVVSV
jgi:hypothetical protein